ncbi:MAG: hypothetical protein ACI831_001383, partial [Candidatus Azotimanducaceae bacterium]
NGSPKVTTGVFDCVGEVFTIPKVDMPVIWTSEGKAAHMGSVLI